MAGGKERAATPLPLSNQPRARWGRFVWPIVVGLVAVGSTHLYRTVGKNTGAPAPAPPPSLTVQRESLRGRSYSEIAEYRKPIILTDTVAHQWPALKAFSTSFLAETLPWVMAHRQEEYRSFMTFHDHKPLEPLVNEKWEEFNTKHNVTIPEILQWHKKDREALKGPYLYFSQDIATLQKEFPNILDYVQPINDLIQSNENVQVNLWIGRAGIVTHTHYDCTYNFFVQLRGKKRFTLFPPSSPMYLYPCLHPHYGHSQVDVLSPNPSHFPHFTRDGSTVAEVLPGDMLVVPPFWFHHVETLEESVSVNVWSDAPEYELLNKIYEQPIPFEETWEWPEMARATGVYINMLIQSIASSDYLPFIQDLVDQRYQQLVISGNINVNTSVALTLTDFCQTIEWDRESLHLTPVLQRGLNLLKPLFLQIPTSATKNICLGNYIEHLIHTALGLDYVYLFLKTCWDQETVIIDIK